ncbi:pyrimidine/purine nucleoside phosphorylase [Metabacillus halosaccharovorans]|uniref:pyrimidine/purine nucleoside phosphorylase n=1 Tax=Metabacillus halosaccharovorans TaxID=930124 RepID=UPI00203DD858|nr:pyrimidine/purine nucleoside phosphorylase [Metabacillus halosaccharovorans]MCM3442294.1 pyrimidine/purine nucleoside phosphorylase [Metabacillus halosaccharovorans]
MSKFENITIKKKANLYFEGKVSSRTILFSNGTKKTLGVMQPGEYEFSTSVKEEMDIVSGQLEYKLAGEDWKSIDGQGVFYVPANETFQVKAQTVVDYCCSYLNE